MTETQPQTETMTIGALLLRAAEKWPAKEAIVFPEERYTFAELAERSLAFARSLAALGVGPGVKVGMLMPNCPEFLFGLFGIQLLGAVAVPVNTRFRGAEIVHVVDRADISVLMTCEFADDPVDYFARVGEAFPGLEEASDPLELEFDSAPRLRTVVGFGAGAPAGFLARSEFDRLGEVVASEPIAAGERCGDAGDVALILFTSGTTSHPKGCLLTHRSLLACWGCVGGRMDVGEGDRVFDPLPLFHLGCLGPTLVVVMHGATMLTMRHFEAGSALDLIERERATWLYTIFPPITMQLIQHPTFPQRDFGDVRALMNVAPRETLDVIGRAFAPIPHLQGQFGMTEGSGSMSCNRLHDTPEGRVATAGPPLDGMEVRVVDPDSGERLGAGERGELHVRGVCVFEGYYDDPSSTATVLDPEGWLHTGDIGEMDGEGRVIYLGRLKEMLKVGGENVAPAEIESHISTHPAVKLVQVVPLPDPRLDEVPVAFVELMPGEELSGEEVIEYCRGKIASFKIPRQVRFVSEWPMSATKIQKTKLRERLAAETAGR
jgi:acyl-CoA synthetase (AMP-forming)/AMP-acid ligase II